MSINSFKRYIDENASTAYFTFGRFNPPTIGHLKLCDKVADLAGKSPYKIFLSQSQDTKKNPLSYVDKIKNVRRMFPRHARSIISNKKIRTAIEGLVSLYDSGFTSVVMVVGSDRVTEFEVLSNKYNGIKARHGFYNFKSIKVVSAGDRDPDAAGVEGVSASKQREFVAKNDFASFSRGVPSTMAHKDVKRLFADIRVGMGLKENAKFTHHVELKKVSKIREDYVKGVLFEIGDNVIIKESKRKGRIDFLGSNYVIVELSDGTKSRQWLKNVKKLEETRRIVENTIKKNILKTAISIRKRRSI